MLKTLLILIGLIIILIGVILIYDSRLITKKIFGFGDQNEGSFWLKILGLMLTSIGGFLILFV